MPDNSLLKVQFHFLAKTSSLANRKELKSFLLRYARKEGYKIEQLNYVFCSDPYLRKINKEYLQHDYNTDIVTFNLSETKYELTGDIYISLDRIRANASTYSATLRQELHRVIFHGLLHLLGYNDKTPAQAKEMRAMEDRLLKLYFK